MKKLLSVLLAILCMMSLTTVSFAAEDVSYFDEETGTLYMMTENWIEDLGIEETDEALFAFCGKVKTVYFDEECGIADNFAYCFYFCNLEKIVVDEDSTEWFVYDNALYGNYVDGDEERCALACYPAKCLDKDIVLHPDATQFVTEGFNNYNPELDGDVLNENEYNLYIIEEGQFEKIKGDLAGIGNMMYIKFANIYVNDTQESIDETIILSLDLETFSKMVAFEYFTAYYSDYNEEKFDEFTDKMDEIQSEIVAPEDTDDPVAMKEYYTTLYSSWLDYANTFDYEEYTEELHAQMGREPEDYAYYKALINRYYDLYVFCRDRGNPVKPLSTLTSSGICGESLMWSFDEATGTLTISGEGEMAFPNNSVIVPWDKYREDIKSVILPEGLTSVGGFTFCKNLTSITIPDSVTSIGDFAFAYCDNLETITLGAGVNFESYDSGFWFVGDKNLKNIVVSEENPYLSTDEKSVLYNKDKTALIYAPAKGVGDSFIIPDSVTDVGGMAFVDCRDFSLALGPSFTDDEFEILIQYISAKEFIVSEENQYLTSVDGVLYDKDVTSLYKYPVCSDRKTFVVPETVDYCFEFAFMSYTADYGLQVLSHQLNGKEIKTINMPESLSVHFASGNCEFSFLTGPKHVYFYADESNSETVAKTVEELNADVEAMKIAIEKDLERFANEYPEGSAVRECGLDYITRMYIDGLPHYVVCDGDHTEAHPYTITVTTEATCKTEGVMTYTCVCGDTYTQALPVKDHETVPFEQKSTCSVAGYKCDVCEACGEKINVENLELLPHSWGEWEVETEPTTEQEGVEKRTCSDCGATEEKSIPKLDEPTFGEKIVAFFEKVGNFFVSIYEWFINLF